jgi:peptide/nickel transport system substrate-binding protein/oligopeptide transport system substrate-binding protein
MRSGKKFAFGFLPTLFVLMGMLLVGCGSSSSPTTTKPSPAPASQQVYRVGIEGSDIATFDPGIATDENSITAIDTVFTGLLSLNDKLQVQPQLASSYSSSADGLTWTFTLRPNLKFSDGTPLTSQDVVYSIDRALSPAVADQNGVTQTYLGLIKDSSERINGKISTLIDDSLIAPDPNTVEIKVSEKTAYFLEALTYPTADVVEKSVIDKWGTQWTNHLSDNGGQGGDGPFKVASYSHTTGIDLVPNTYYYGAQTQLKHLDLVFYKTTDTMYQAYMANQLDNTAVPSADDAAAEALKNQFVKAPQLSIFYITMNYLYKPFDNIDIRQALSLAINRDVIAKSIFNGLVTPTCHIVPQGMPGYDPNLQCPGGAPTSGNTAKAKQLFAAGLAQEGLTTATFPSISLVYPSGDQGTTDEITTVIGMWQSVLGISITPHAEDFNQLLTDVNNTVCTTPTDLSKCVNKGLAMWWLGWLADYPDPQDWTTLQFDKGAPNNAWNYGQNLSLAASEQQAVQAELEKADADLGSDRMSLYNDAEQKLVNDVAWLSLQQPDGVGLIKPYVYGVIPNAQGLTPANDWANIYITTH